MFSTHMASASIPQATKVTGGAGLGSRVGDHSQDAHGLCCAHTHRVFKNSQHRDGSRPGVAEGSAECREPCHAICVTATAARDIASMMSRPKRDAMLAMSRPKRDTMLAASRPKRDAKLAMSRAKRDTMLAMSRPKRDIASTLSRQKRDMMGPMSRCIRDRQSDV